MRIHREGKNTLIIAAIILLVFNSCVYVFFDEILFIFFMANIISVVLFYIVLQFFRSPKRNTSTNENSVISPADGKIVVIERTVENEYFKDERIQISIFMSLWNVHINWFPISGLVKFFRYHRGKYLLARNPKSSTENERTSIVIQDKKQREILYRQIAGQVARRIVFYIRENDQVEQSKQCGFIKFGSRIDIFLPLDSDIKVKIGDKVTGSVSEIAGLK